MASHERTPSFGRQLRGLHADVPQKATGMVVKFDRHVFTIRFPPTAESQTDHVYVNWAQLFGEETWCGQQLSLQPLT